MKLIHGSAEPVYGTTGADGRFEFPNPGTGDCELGVWPVDEPRWRVPVKLESSPVTIRLSPLPPYAVLSGRVTDPNGIPLAHAWVEISEKVESLGAQPRVALATLTNDAGEYREPHLKAGTYYVAVTGTHVWGFWDRNYRTTYFPDSTDASSARSLTVAAGQEIRADIRIQRPVSGAGADQAPDRAGEPAQAVTGRIVDALTGAPVAGAYVLIAGSSECVEKPQSVAFSDSEGRFQAVPPEPDCRVMQVTRTGYLSAFPKVPAAANDVRIELKPQTSISGTIEDEDRLPTEGIRVEALREVIERGQSKLSMMNLFVLADDRGEYRITGLAPGHYYLRVSPSALNAWDRRYVPEYYPGALEAGKASPIALQAGQQLSGVDFHLTRHDGVAVSGHVLTPDGEPAGSAQVYLELEDESFTTAYASYKPGDGGFSIGHVPPGDYVVHAVSGKRSAPDFLAEEHVHIGDAELRDIVLRYHAAEPTRTDSTDPPPAR